MNAARYPVWASLARDVLSVMASSVSSERAFSSAGITISKRRNRLKGDIVEALQGLKCMIRHDLLFRPPGPSVNSETASDDDTGDPTGDSPAAAPTAEGVEGDDEQSWDQNVVDLDSEDEEYGDDDDDVDVQDI